MIDRVADGLGRALLEVPVGFKWFVPGLLDGSVGFGGEESAGASFLQRDGSVWTTDKDGIILALLAAEITAVTGQLAVASCTRPDRALRRARLRPHRHRRPRREQKAALAKLVAGAGHRPRARRRADHRRADHRARATARRSAGSRSSPTSGWFAARPSGTEDVYKLYAESFRGPDHLAEIQEEARAIIAAALGLTAARRISGSFPGGSARLGHTA